MKKAYIFRLWAFCLLISLTFVAAKCGPDPQPQPTVSKKDLISKEWKVDKVLINDVRDQTTDYNSYRRKFNADGSYKFTDAPGIVKKGTWELSSSEQKIVLDKDTDEEQTVSILGPVKPDKMELEFTSNHYKTGHQEIVYKLVQ